MAGIMLLVGVGLLWRGGGLGEAVARPSPVAATFGEQIDLIGYRWGAATARAGETVTDPAVLAGAGGAGEGL